MPTRVLLRTLIRILYGLFLLVPLYVVYKNSGGLIGFFKYFQQPSLTTYLFLRLTGLYAFFLIFLQIVHGGFMPLWKKIFDAKATVSHEKQGVLAYCLVLTHPLFFTLSAILAAGLKNGVITLFPSFETKTDLFLASSASQGVALQS
ncbi:MAG: hypothetical protein AAB599_01530 [Patescibacteria group bacterium]